jgi:ADP-dependent NAD(P)H-hydrate dehydratase
MPSPEETITPTLLRAWPLPEPGGSKLSRGQVLVVGGAASTPGGVLLAGEAALRVGAGRLKLAVAESVAATVAVAVPESAVTGLPEGDGGTVLGDGAARLEAGVDAADAVLVGPGLDDGDETAALLRALAPMLDDDTAVVLDAYALGVLPRLDDLHDRLAGRLVLTPNPGEAARLLGEDELDDLATAVPRIAERFGAVVTCQDVVAAPDGRRWAASSGFAGLGTSGSGDVLAGAVTGLVARGADLDQAACWGTHLHAAAGDRLAARVGPLGFLARELLDQLPLVMVELNAH